MNPEPFQPEPLLPSPRYRPGTPIAPSLDLHETSSRESDYPHPGPDNEARSSLETSFRHSFWAARRVATYEALSHLRTDAQVLQRFERCGTQAWVHQCQEDPTQFAIFCNRCKSRWCEACQVERRRNLARNLQELLPPGRLRLLTLTLRPARRSLTELVDKILLCFAKLRRKPALRHKLQGGIYFMECKIGKGSGEWNVHLHVLCQGQFLPQTLISKLWHEVTEDSHIVDVREARTTARAIGYVTKYASKALSPNVWKNPVRFREAIQALGDRRLYGTFGSFRGFKLSKPPESDLTWKPVVPLWVLCTQRERGEGGVRGGYKAAGRRAAGQADDEHNTHLHILNYLLTRRPNAQDNVDS